MSEPTARDYHQLDLRVGYGDETSNETYTGLTDADFAAAAAAPLRRVAARPDELGPLAACAPTHRVELGLHTRVETAAYRHKFHRAWGKVDGFVGQRDFYGLLADADAGANAVYYAILTGQADSSSPEEQLILGTNDRTFTSQGVQTDARDRAARPVRSRTTSTPACASTSIAPTAAATRTRYDMVGGELVRTRAPARDACSTRAPRRSRSRRTRRTSSTSKRLEVTAGPARSS